MISLASKNNFSTGARGQRKTQDPCLGCGLHKKLCICEFIPQLNLRTRVCLVIHASELKRTTNTGTLAVKALTNSATYVRGELEHPLDLTSILSPDYHTLLFYPADEAIELNREFIELDSRPIQLIVPDGNWRQASKVHYRHKELKDIPRVMIKTPNHSANHLRAETREEGMATLQAIAEALGIIEGDQAKAVLLELYSKKLEHTLIGRKGGAK